MSGVLNEIPQGFATTEIMSVMSVAKSALVLGLDIGTSGVRATLFDESGREVDGAGVRTQRSLSRFSDFSVIDPNALLDLVVDTIDQLLAQPHFSTAEVELISISCFWHSLVGLDSNGQPTTPVLGWAEKRAAQAAKDLRARFDETETHSRTGCRFHPSYWPAKLLWLRAEQPETFNATILWLSFSEYLTLKLFADTSMSVSMASGTGLFDQRKCNWDKPLLQALDIPVESLPEIATNVVSDSELAGDYAQRWPRLSKARLCPAIADGAANNIGAGCTTRAKLALMIGTSGAARLLYEGEPPERIPPELWCYRADRSRVLVGGALSDGGGLYRWLQDLLLSHEDSAAIKGALEAQEADAHGLTILPFWAGERSTGWSLNATGGILGLTLDTQPIEIMRAAMEAIAYRFAQIVKALEPISPAASIIAAGNALQSSPVWLQIIADVLDRPVTLSSTREASMRGAALLALEGAGRINSINQVNSGFEKMFEPDASRHARYREGIERQQKLYDAVIALS